MDSFNDLIKAEFTPPSTWILSRELSFKTDHLSTEEIEILRSIGVSCNTVGEISVPPGFETDLASVPRQLWTFLSPWDVARAAVVHDQLYLECAFYYLSEGADKKRWEQARKVSDKVFLLAMNAAAPPVSKWKMKAAYYAVRMFGKKAAKVLDDRKLKNLEKNSEKTTTPTEE